MKATFMLRGAIAAAATFAALGLAAPALAISSDTTGAEAYGNSSGTWPVYDTKCDSESAYGNFIEKNHTGVQRKNNTSGCDTVSKGDIGDQATDHRQRALTIYRELGMPQAATVATELGRPARDRTTSPRVPSAQVVLNVAAAGSSAWDQSPGASQRTP
jgi:hypothetical protein